MAATTAGVAVGLGVAGLVMQAGGASKAASAQRKAGRAAKKAAEYDAGIAEQNAELARADALTKSESFMFQFQLAEGSNRASVGASGVKGGSIGHVLYANAANAAHDSAAIIHQGEIQRQKFLDDAESMRRGGRAASSAANRNASAELLRGAGQAISSIGQIAGAYTPTATPKGTP